MNKQNGSIESASLDNNNSAPKSLNTESLANVMGGAQTEFISQGRRIVCTGDDPRYMYCTDAGPAPGPEPVIGG